MAFGDVPTDQLTKFGSSMTIEELSPAGNGVKPRKVVLIGSSLPFMGAEWACENNVITTWYPGNGTEATQQNLGPREMPSSWEGMWRRTLMGKHPTIYIDDTGGSNQLVSPHILREVIEDIMRAGMRLRVTWSVKGTSIVGSVNQGGQARNENVQIIREGRIKTFRTPIDRHTDIRWTLEFHWMSRGGRQDKVAAVHADNDASTAAQALEASVNATTDFLIRLNKPARATVLKSATHFTLGQLENLASAPTRAVNSFLRKLQQNVSSFKRIGDVVLKLRSQPFAIANSVVDFAHNTTSVANNFINELGRQPAEQRSLKTKVSSLLRATNHFGTMSNAAVLNARRGYELDVSVRNILVSGANRGALTVRSSSATRKSDIIAIHISKTGDTPQSVSQKYYSNPDQGVAILRANRMPWFTPTFARGQLLVIPVLSLAGRSNA